MFLSEPIAFSHSAIRATNIHLQRVVVLLGKEEQKRIRMLIPTEQIRIRTDDERFVEFRITIFDFKRTERKIRIWE